ncbi:uncharacterized protein UV8b_01404 [Ustilaginoidea virens]|uniref:N-acetyltransferase domain-containing protein n=1 Tax=Ustilaginoidea virens TaxID=1159556 RepID=A0A1B5L893_USTVR|nr:uncharacterized protein UV8b_01404 [Ustilaginoidea virens]QUC17163.1 hypothetical protein UV8b_01404 [Ustilaginoidea virens]GAO19930.1 hypothetical protein UVI_02062830 [Ustilaginoidea virens]
MSRPTHVITPVRPQDVAEIGQLSSDAFMNDRQTQMKMLGKRPYDMKEITLSSLPGMLGNPRCVAVKITDEETGKIMGFCNWGFRGFQPEEIATFGGEPPRQPPTNETEAGTESQDKDKGKAYDGPRSSDSEAEPEDDPISRLQALTGGDLEKWMEHIMPQGTRCIFVIGLAVSPAYQGRGVGSALLRWGTSICDKEQVFAWVHSSEMEWPMYEKSGFRVARVLDVDLDEYAPAPPPNKGPGSQWGHYMFRYMTYVPGRYQARTRSGE